MILTGTFDLHSRDPWTQAVYRTWFVRDESTHHYVPPVLQCFDDPLCWEPGHEGSYAAWCREMVSVCPRVFADHDMRVAKDLKRRLRTWDKLKQDMKAGVAVEPVQFRVEPDGSLFLLDGRHRIAVAWALGRPVAAEYELTDGAQEAYERALREGLGRPYQKPLHPMFSGIDGWRHDAKRFDVILRDACPRATGGQAIDVGASYGRFAWGLHDAGACVTAVDPEPVDERFWPGAVPRVASVFDIEWEGDGPRVLLLLAVLHHMTDVERARCEILANEADVVYVEPTVPENPCLHVDMEQWMRNLRGERELIYTTADVNGRPVYRWRRA